MPVQGEEPGAVAVELEVRPRLVDDRLLMPVERVARGQQQRRVGPAPRPERRDDPLDPVGARRRWKRAADSGSPSASIARAL
jgi:hypothetical protein